MRRKTALLLAITLIAVLLCACGKPTPENPSTPTPPLQKSTPTSTAPAASQEDQTAFNGKWVNEQGGYTLAVKNGQYRFSEPKKLFIMAGDCKSDGPDKLLCGQYTVTLQNGALMVGGIDGEFVYTKVYDGGAGPEFLGDWENDTSDYKLVISARECAFSSMSGGSSSVMTYAVVTTGLDIGGQDEEMLIELTPDEGLKAGGYEGTFYRVGTGKGAPSRFAPYLGEWENADAQVTLSIQEGGYALAGNVSDLSNLSMSMGGCSINENGTLALGGDQTVTKNADGTLGVSGIEGVFEKTGEYTPPTPAPTQQPAATPLPKPRREHPDMQYGLTEASSLGLVFLEPETGSRVTLPGILAEGLIMSEMDTAGGVGYIMITSPVPEEEFSLLGSEITAMCTISFDRIGAKTTEDVIRYFSDPDFDSFKVIKQTKNHVLLCEYETSGEMPRHIYKWGYLYGDGSVLSVSLTLNEADTEEMSGVVIEPGAVAAQGEASLLPDGPTEAAGDEKAVGWGLAIGAWYSEEQDGAIICNADGTATLTNSGGEKLQSSYTIFYGDGFADTPHLLFDFEGDIVDGMMVLGDLLVFDERQIFARVSAESLPEHLK